MSDSILNLLSDTLGFDLVLSKDKKSMKFEDSEADYTNFDKKEMLQLAKEIKKLAEGMD